MEKQVKEALDTAERPLYLFDDDVDGLCAFLLFYRYKKSGVGIPVKVAGGVTEVFLQKTAGYDKVFILDVPNVSEEFFEKMTKPIIWVDHHPEHASSALTYNIQGTPTSLLCYTVVEQDLWIAMMGSIGDWVLDKEKAKQFREKYPDLLPASCDTPEKALFDSNIGFLARMMNFLLKGQMKDIKKSMNVLTRIESPYDLLQKKGPAALLWKRYEVVQKVYEVLLEKAKKEVGEDVVFTYEGNISVTSELSNELLYLYPEKLIVVAREKNGDMRASLRSTKNVRAALEKALEGVQGRGGGHEHGVWLFCKEI